MPNNKGEKYIENLQKNIEKQENVDIQNIRYILTESGDNSEEILKKLKCIYKVIKPNEFSHSLTREKEAFESKADILVFITQDIVIQRSDWLYKLIEPIQKEECEASFSRQICENNSIEKYTREFNYPKDSYIVSKDDIPRKGLKAFFFSDASSAIRRKIFKEINGYDQKKFPTNEDMYIAYKIITKGYKIKYCADSEIVHSHQFTLKQYYNRYLDTGKFFKENSYLNNYKVNQAGGNMAKYVFRRAIEDRNWKVLIEFIPNMAVRFIAMLIGKKE